MAIQDILLIGNKNLRETSELIDFNSDDIKKMIEDLSDTLHSLQKKFKTGRAIAGPQIGLLKRIIYMETSDQRIVMINPVITNKSKETFSVWDSCFSVNVAFFSNTIRHKKITVEYFNENYNKVTATFKDDLSELFQHEIEHLDGILFTDHTINNQIIMREELEKLELNRLIN